MLNINEYFDGKVKSIGFQTSSLPASVGVMAPGEYEFSTTQKETMIVISGQMSVKLPDSEQWQTFKNGDSFIVIANEEFQLKIDINTAYLCTYE